MNEKITESKNAIHVGCSDNSAMPPHGLLILFIILDWFWRQKKTAYVSSLWRYHLAIWTLF